MVEVSEPNTPSEDEALVHVEYALRATPMQVALAWFLQRSPNILVSHLGRPEHEIGLSSGLTPWVTSPTADMSHPSPQQ